MKLKMKSKLKLLTIFCLLLCAVTFVPVQAKAASAKTRALKAYKKFLSQKTISWYGDGYIPVSAAKCSFGLAYIDNNAVPELILYSPELPHAIGYGAVYTYSGGKVKLVENINLDTEVYYYKKKGVLISSYVQGGVHTTYYKYKKAKITPKLREGFQLTMKGNEPYYGKIQSDKLETISKSAFNKALKKMVGSKKKTKVKLYTNTSSNRKKHLK